MAPWTRLDPTSVDLTDFDLASILRTTVDATETLRDRTFELAKDAMYVTVGLGVLSLQRAQVRRRELERAIRR